MRQLTGATFRASRQYRAVAYTELPVSFRARLGSTSNAGSYEVLMPHAASGIDAKLVCHDTARLFHALQEAAPLPASVVELLGPRTNDAIAKLVLDGILELEDGGQFVSGPDAFGSVFSSPPQYELRGSIGALTTAALASASMLGQARTATLTRHLYRYNTAPCSPRWRRSFSSAESVAAHLTTVLPPAARRAIEQSWFSLDDHEPSVYWIRWGRATVATEPRLERPPMCKLYISPQAAALRDAFHAALPLLARSPALAFKVGRRLPGVLRPDKFVVYFACREDMMQTAHELTGALAGITAQGVPLTAGITNDGLLSWGIDPAAKAQTSGRARGQSWRSWVAGRLAGSLRALALCAAKPDPGWMFALAALALDGIDPASFVPGDDIWAGSHPL